MSGFWKSGGAVVHKANINNQSQQIIVGMMLIH